MTDDAPGAAIGRRLRALREEQLLSRPELAKRAGVGIATIDHVERGMVARPRRTTLEKLSKPLGVSIEDLIGSASRPMSPPLVLATMYDASPAERRRALDAASEAEIARYLRDIDQQVGWAERAIASPEGAGAGNQRPLRRYVRHLLMLRDEADPDEAAPPSQDEIAALVGHAAAEDREG